VLTRSAALPPLSADLWHLHSLLDVRLSHIHHDVTLEGYEQAEERLLSRHKLTGDLLTDRNQRLAEAYAQQERKLG